MSFVLGNPPRSCDLTTMHARMRPRTPDNDVVPSDVIIFVRLRATMRRGPACPSCAQGNGRRAGAASTGRSGLEEGGGHPDAGHWWSLAAATPAQVRSATLPALRSRTRLPRLDGPVAVDLLLGDAVVPHPTHEVAHLPAMVAPAGTQKCTRSRPPGLTLSDVMMSCQDSSRTHRLAQRAGANASSSALPSDKVNHV